MIKLILAIVSFSIISFCISSVPYRLIVLQPRLWGSMGIYYSCAERRDRRKQIFDLRYSRNRAYAGCTSDHPEE